MKVEQLIKKLQELPPDTHVRVSAYWEHADHRETWEASFDMVTLYYCEDRDSYNNDNTDPDRVAKTVAVLY